MNKSLEDMADKLKDMYKKIRQINILNKECERLQEYIRDMNSSMRNITNHISSDIRAIDYSAVKVQTSNNCSSSMEQQMMATITRYENRIIDLNEKISERHEKIILIEEEIMNLRFNIEELGEDSRKFIELLYRDERSMAYIAREFNVDENTAYRRRDALLENISQRVYIAC